VFIFVLEAFLFDDVLLENDERLRLYVRLRFLLLQQKKKIELMIRKMDCCERSALESTRAAPQHCPYYGFCWITVHINNAAMIQNNEMLY